MLVIAVVGVVLDALVLALFCAFVLATLFQLGVNGRRRCPARQRDVLEPFGPFSSRRSPMTTSRCACCRAAFRTTIDDSLEAMP